MSRKMYEYFLDMCCSCDRKPDILVYRPFGKTVSPSERLASNRALPVVASKKKFFHSPLCSTTIMSTNFIDTVIAHLENTNSPMGQTECAVLNSRIPSIEAEISSLDEEIAKMVHQRDLLQEKCKHCRRLLSPLRGLPNKILLEIFTDFPRDDQTSVYRMSQVCRSWRQLVLGAPLLWTDIVLPGPLGNVSFEHIWRYLSLHVRRSQSRLMSSTIEELPEDLLDLLFEAIFASVVAHWDQYPFMQQSWITFNKFSPTWRNTQPKLTISLHSLLPREKSISN
ncbi:hypothetical protein CPB83DRAFT_291639 [Crepidotus variabilis]|uniref:F-box domain-containing protein n=1 Tax=Crepidotus variabilis TaxID=179855 RepID=A0A9P6EHA1_9AGAR|nr:hypothetical protein CPB83DRAFT_291639 [Crepidotus variabilis]